MQLSQRTFAVVWNVLCEGSLGIPGIVSVATRMFHIPPLDSSMDKKSTHSISNS